MTETKIPYHVGDPTAEDRQRAERLRVIWAELDRERAALPNDAFHEDVFRDLGAAQAALDRAREKLLLWE